MDLSDAGQACCHVGRGTFIQDGSIGAPSPAEKAAGFGAVRTMGKNDRFSPHNPLEYAARRLRMGVGKALRDILSLAEKSGIIHLTKGVPDPRFLPENFLAEVTQQTMHNHGANLIEATDPQGSYDLRKEIARRFTAEGTAITPDQVLITNGSMQAVTLVAQANMETGQRVLCETPCFKGITDSFAAMGHWVETITRDAHGPGQVQLNQLPQDLSYLLGLGSYQ